MSTLSREENLMVLSGEVCSSTAYPDDDDDGGELELGLGLSLGGGARGKSASRSVGGSGGGGGQYARILTAKDFPSAKSSSSSSSSSSGAKAHHHPSCGTKRTADSVSPPRSGVSQVVGWPPVRTYRINNLNQAKTPVTEEFTSTFEKGKSKTDVAEKIDSSSDKSNNSNVAKGLAKTSLFVKVNMDGIPIGRKVDLNAHRSYEALGKTLDDMFCRPSSAVITIRGLNVEEKSQMLEATRSLRLLDESSEFVLTYEDKDGDWMLVGDVPWEMFLSSVKRLRIMKASEANGLAPRSQERNGRQRTKPI